MPVPPELLVATLRQLLTERHLTEYAAIAQAGKFLRNALDNNNHKES